MSDSKNSMDLIDAAGIEDKDLRKAFGQFPTGVAIVTTRTNEGEDLGMTMSSFSSLSMTPPLVLFSIGRHANSLAKWQATDAYAINILRDDQHALSDRFARALSDKWAGVTFDRGHAGVPILRETAACFVCKPHAQHESGDHLLFIAEIIHVAVNHEATPLIFCQGRYGEIQPQDKP